MTPPSKGSGRGYGEEVTPAPFDMVTRFTDELRKHFDTRFDELDRRITDMCLERHKTLDRWLDERRKAFEGSVAAVDKKVEAIAAVATETAKAVDKAKGSYVGVAVTAAVFVAIVSLGLTIWNTMKPAQANGKNHYYTMPIPFPATVEPKDDVIGGVGGVGYGYSAPRLPSPILTKPKKTPK
jgi:hypothetical protein